MKKLIIYVLCIIILMQNCIATYASEADELFKKLAGEELQKNESTIVEEEELLQDEETIEKEEEQLQDEETIEKEEEQLQDKETIKIEEDQRQEELIEESKEQLQDKETMEEQMESEDIVDEVMQIEMEDPQFGRENGYLSEEIETVQMFSTRNLEYGHDAKFEDYTIKDVIDVSKYQGDIDWMQVKQSGIDYAIIRVGYRGYSTGKLEVDEKFIQNINGALDVGIEVGVYIFSQAITEEEVIEEAEYILNLIRGYDISLPVVIDFEYASTSAGLTGRLYSADLSREMATRICNRFCEEIEKNGYTAMVYANKTMLEKNLNASEIAENYEIWLANYATSTSYSGDYNFWQYTQSGTITGISGKVDKNFWYVQTEQDFFVECSNEKISDTLGNRIYGETRYETSFGIAEEYKARLGVEKFDNVIVTCGTNFADALAGSYLANLKKAPILITDGKNAKDVKEYIKQNLNFGGTVYILGGTVAVPEGVGCGLKQFTVKRLAGETRYETNVAILKEAGVSNQDILICTGENFADSLSASATKRPILLVSDKLTPQQMEYLSSLSESGFYIIGGENAVSKSLENEIQRYGAVQRFGGETRFETSVMLAERFFDSPSSAVLAYSHNFPDGLCGGLLAMSIDAPLILTRTGDEQVAKFYAEKNNIHKGYVFGGNGLISDEAVQNIFGKCSELEKIVEAKFVRLEEKKFKILYNTFISDNLSNDGYYYLMQVDSYSGLIYGSPLATVSQSNEISISISDLQRSKLKELTMDKLVLATRLNDGTYKSITDSVNISNSEAIAQNIAPIFKGTSKKGLQGVTYASDSNKPMTVDARYTNTKQTLINLDLATVVSKSPKSGYNEYSYKGNIYYFSDLTDLKENIKSLNFGYKQYLYGNSGRTPVAVTLCLLLGYNQENSFLIDPAARIPGHAYYTLNVREEYARETLEALFFYLGETFGQSDCYVSNWILGNEINSSKAWNYSGSLDFDTYMECYTTAFRMLYTAVKSEKTGNTVSVSLDNGWTAAPDTYAGKVTLDTFAKKIHAQNQNIDWSIAYHPYSYPLTRGDFWNDYSNTTDNLSTPYISMRNINVLTNYAGTLESTYGKKSGSIRILLTEQGYSYAAGKEVQAQAIARGYYIAEFNDRIDAFIIRAIVDDEDEAKGKLYFGLMNSQQDKRISYYVYEHMDSDLSRLAQQSAEGYVTEDNYTNFNNAKSILCNTNWNAIVPGFNAAKLAGIK